MGLESWNNKNCVQKAEKTKTGFRKLKQQKPGLESWNHKNWFKKTGTSKAKLPFVLGCKKID